MTYRAMFGLLLLIIALILMVFGSIISLVQAYQEGVLLELFLVVSTPMFLGWLIFQVLGYFDNRREAHKVNES